MASGPLDDPAVQRVARLSKLLHAYVQGTKAPRTANDGKLLLEAIAAQSDLMGCVERLTASKNALDAVKLSLRFDVSTAFLNGPFTDFSAILTDHAVSQTCGGQLQKILLDLLVRPPTLWDALTTAHTKKQLSMPAERTFAALLLELVSWIDRPPVDVDGIAQEITDQSTFLNSDDRDLRTIGYRIQHVLQTKGKELQQDPHGPGGRHDNDHTDFRKIAIFPTDDELMSKEMPFYRLANAITSKSLAARPGVWLDNQFRLLRANYLAELREDIEISRGNKKGRRPKTRLQGLSLQGAYCGDHRFKTPFALALSVMHGLEVLTQLPEHLRHKHLKDNPKFLKHQSFGCVIDQGRVVTFATLLREVDLLSQGTPAIVLRTPDRSTLEKLLTCLKSSKSAQFIMVDTPVFAFEPVLHCLQDMVEIPLSEELFAASGEEVEAAVRLSSIAPLEIADEIESDGAEELKSILSLKKSVSLDDSQLRSLLAGLRQSVSLIQGPPGTGKSFIGALLAKAMTKFTSETILVVCFTNHALDQFLEDLMDIGIPASDMVRLGAKSTTRTECLQLSKQQPNRSHPYDVINTMKEQAEEQEDSVTKFVSSLRDFKPDRRNMMDHLEFSDDDSDFFYAFQMPERDAEETLIGAGGRHVDEHYLYDRWYQGRDAGVFKDTVGQDFPKIWSMDTAARREKVHTWTAQLLQDRILGIGGLAEAYNQTETTLREAWQQRDTDIIVNKRIIACTTTAAAKYTNQIRSAAPGVIIVEEAGEILESHILTAMTPSTRQLILIGDHQQLRPKVSDYALSVEKGEGFDLNRSMFERLILAGLPHTTLSQQHRMCPEISSLVRELTYPDLVDAPATLKRGPVRGLQSRVSWVDHRHPELSASRIADRHDDGSMGSKENIWEVSMVLKVVRYAAQQGYGTANQVVLTPYLGQLNLLRQELAKDHDPVLNDLDSFDLIKAGLMTPSGAAQKKNPIKISTIDNYQGEECDIVIATMTRSNNNGDIGFMVAPQRLNVLLSRARTALIMIGNSKTFRASKKGANTWKPFFDILVRENRVHDGLPVKCEQHPDRQVVLQQPSDFDALCPDGGCSAPCGSKLMCGLHDCEQKCHARTDHSKTPCHVLVGDTCPQKHELSWRCSGLRPASCPTCDGQAAAAAKRKQRDEELDQLRQQKQNLYAQQLAEIQDEKDHHRRLMREHHEDEERKKTLSQQLDDLETVRQSQQAQSASTTTTTVPGSSHQDTSAQQTDDSNDKLDPNNRPTTPPGNHFQPSASAARDDWDHQKQFEGQKNKALDDLMAMVGLENVKESFLEIKAKVDLTVRQGIKLTKERFGVSLLGNPGTGKTTVARLYSTFLASVGALPGNHFVETTGAKLANEGVQGCKKLLDDIVSSGGGALFIDEAYQLTSGNSPTGAAVLDFLLPEVENLTGKVVFVLAGYNKEMEPFFAHNPGLPSRFPREIQFADYEDNELLEILIYGLTTKYKGRMGVEDGYKGLYGRIVARRVGRGRGKKGFGNARTVENTLAVITNRQAKRIKKERRAGKPTNDLLLTKEDMIGPVPSDVLRNNGSWKKLHQLTGLTSVKDSVKALFDSIAYNYQRELEEKPIMDFSLNKVFLGSPGTGKTTVAKLYGQILADIGMLSSGEVLLKTPADFVGNVIGGSEANTKAILNSAAGKVLVIDEAYGLYPGNGSHPDIFRVAVIDTIVSDVQNVPGDDRCVLLLGYKEQLEDMMQKSNPGLARRFPLDSGFVFEDFTDAELGIILDAKLKTQAFSVAKKARNVAMEMLGRMRNRPNFGNAGQIDILLNDAKVRQQKRFARDHIKANAILEAEDFDPDYQRADRAHTNVKQLFHDVVGCEGIVSQLEGYQNIVRNMRDVGMDPREDLPFSFLFRGPPGTGKTTTARRMGKVYYDMGFLATAEVVECSAKDLIGEYVGQTGPKAQKLIESALGKVLFIDEAYRLGVGQKWSGGGFAQEAVDELVDCMTKPRFVNKMVIILAGYENEINQLTAANPGLSSRFPETVDFQGLNPAACFHLLRLALGKKKQIDSDLLTSPSDTFLNAVLDKFAALVSLNDFANGRDVQTLAKGIVGNIMKSKKPAQGSLIVTERLIIAQIDGMIAERESRGRAVSAATKASASKTSSPMRNAPQKPPPPPATTSSQGSDPSTTTAGQSSQSPARKASEGSSSPTQPPQNGQDRKNNSKDGAPHDDDGTTAVRDAGVSDVIWEQLQRDWLQAVEEENERKRLAKEEEDLKLWLQKCADAKRQIELEEIARKRRELEEKKQREAEDQRKLAQAGCCPMGYAWIKQIGGYRCAGGSHCMSEAQVNRL